MTSSVATNENVTPIPEAIYAAIEEGPSLDEGFNDEWKRRQLFATRIARMAYEAGRALSETRRLEPEWVVNDIAELGVKLGDDFFWLYKGDNIIYKDATHDNGSPMHWRPVGKREFGECCHPVNYADPHYNGAVSLDDSDQWKPLPNSKHPGGGMKQSVDEKDGVLPCPFCGGASGIIWSRDQEVVNVRCENWLKSCMGAGKNCYLESEAIEAWNHRAAVPSATTRLPEGWQAVPVVPTEEMRLAGSTAIQAHYRRDGGWCGLAAAQEQMMLTWVDMLIAAPSQAEQPGAREADLAMMVQRLARRILLRADGENKATDMRLAYSGLDLVKRLGLEGSPLRENSPADSETKP